MKVLSGAQYTTTARLAGILREIYVSYNNGQLLRQGDVTVYGEGNIATNKLTGDVGLILDSESVYFAHLTEPHLSRLVNVEAGDGWMDTVVEE